MPKDPRMPAYSVGAQLLAATHQQIPVEVSMRDEQPAEHPEDALWAAMLSSNAWPGPHVHTGAREIARRRRQAERKAAKKSD